MLSESQRASSDQQKNNHTSNLSSQEGMTFWPEGGNGSNLQVCTQQLGATEVRGGLSAEQGLPAAAAKLIAFLCFNVALSIISYSLETPPK